MSHSKMPNHESKLKVRRVWKSDGSHNIMPLDHAASLLGTVLGVDPDFMAEQLAIGQVIDTHLAGYQVVMGDEP